MRDLERELENTYPEFSRIWIHYHNKGGFLVSIILFPREENSYHMLSTKTQELTFDSISEVIKEHLKTH